VPEVALSESFYMRYSSQHFLEGQLTPDAIRSQLKQSVNRGNYSEPEDVLFSESGEFNGLGAIELKVSDLPVKLERPDGPTFVFFICHEPEETNYSHSEIWANHEGAAFGFRRPSRTVSLKFRMSLCQFLNSERVKTQAQR
jgi:hypothetical protein